ncbi:uncharacterized protein J8A68_002755 [[Candida] subhashii]|uniref:Uncharacterized protein n=1 Tax=[Candida] subhashii TaxID=561895 RepID=A0A8J5QKB0_9ASCO|nr:uncharacterized protein J8A68_002755 [[Candida] subhashii]KAG7663703.1 hypothetical protein J8A68_002755 [[Candida] subhashii]
MDRQQILELKRQRLQELKQKRSLTVTPTSEHRDGSISPRLPLTKRLVDASTQTSGEFTVDRSSNVRSHEEASEQDRDEVLRYEKAVQTIEVIDSTQLEPKVDETTNHQLIHKQEVSETELNESIAASIKLLNKLKIKHSIDIQDDNEKTSGINLDKDSQGCIKTTCQFHGETRSIRYIDISPFDCNMVLIAYTSTPQSSFNAIVYNIDSKSVFAEFFLSSISSEINIIKFDKYNQNRIIGGLDNGSIVIWELYTKTTHTHKASPIIAPTLQTPLFSTTSLDVMRNSNIIHHSHQQQQHNYEPHVEPIVYLQQLKIDGNDCIVSISRDGIINNWSSNLLVVPRDTTIQVFENNRIGANISIEHAYGIRQDGLVSGSSYIQNLLLGGNNGKIYRASNDKDGQFVPVCQTTVGAGGMGTVITSFAYFENHQNSYIISSHLDWNLRLWQMNSSEEEHELRKIPVAYIVKSLLVRPNRRHQFVTMGYLSIDDRDSKTIIDLWDLERKANTPILNITRDLLRVNCISFSPDGNELYVGKLDGSFTRLEIDDSKIDNEIVENAYDKGIAL